MMSNYDCIILGAGLYGLYSAFYLAKQNKKVMVLEYDDETFSRSSYANQARIHNGYHYPRSYSTAIKSAKYFNRFTEEYAFCINKDFKKIYATSTTSSWTNSEQFVRFCANSEIQCDKIDPEKYFREGKCDGAFVTQEYSYDASILKDYFLTQLSSFKNVSVHFNVRISSVEADAGYIIKTDNRSFVANTVINATYASVNQVLAIFGFDSFPIKYELCETILVKASESLSDVGLTVMDGPFFSLMPFGKTNYHTLTSVTFTPHMSCHQALPSFDCQKNSNGACTLSQLGNCNTCASKPESAWPYMSRLAKAYLRDEYNFEYVKSLYSMKPILKASEIDDSRPTVIKVFSQQPTFISCLSGKINTVFDLDEELMKLD